MSRGADNNTTAHGANDALSFERIVFFSDAVIAIAITLLVIDLRLPDTAGVDSATFVSLLRDLAPHYFAFVLSFVVTALYWMSHHRAFRFIVRYDGRLVVLNVLFLFFVVQLPLTTSILGSYGNLPLANAIYALGLTMLGLSETLLWIYSTRAGLLSSRVTSGYARMVALRGLATAAVFFVSIGICFVSTTLAEVTWVAAAFMPRVLDRLGAPPPRIDEREQ